MTDQTEAEEQKKKPPFRAVFKAIWHMILWGYQSSPRAFPAMLVLLIIVSILPFVTNYLDSRAIDGIVTLLNLKPEDRGLAPLIPMIAVVILSNIIERTLWIGIAYSEKANFFNISRVTTLRFLKKASELDMVHYENPDSHNIIQKAKDTYSWKPAAFLERSMWMTGSLIRVISSIIIALTFSIPAFLLVLCTTLPSLIANVKMGEGSWGIWDANATDRRQFWKSADLLSRENSLMELRIFRSREYLLRLVEEIYDRFTGKERKNQLRRTVFESAVSNLSTLGSMAFWVIAIAATLNGEITLGLFTFYTASLSRFSESLNDIFRSLSSHYEDGLYLIDLFRFLDLENTINPGMQRLERQTNAPLIAFKNVNFAYPGTDKLALHNFNLVIEPGEHVALVGANGAGKTTIIKLLCRFYDVTSGQILINGVDLRDLDLNSWYDQIGVLFQEFIRYTQFEVRKNIELGNVDSVGDLNRLEEAIFKADAHDFINAYEKRLEQLLDKSFEGGTNPSDGQWQKIALARAFFRDAPLLVLDEPTSAIDAKAEYQIFERLYEFSQNKSLIIISHRFSTVRNADKIYVIEDGDIIECGNHHHLVMLNGKYREAFEAQAKGYK